MTAAFAREGDDAGLLCADPAFCYFLVGGRLLPIEMPGTLEAPSPVAFDPLLHGGTASTSHRVPTVEVAAVTGSKVGEAATGMDSPNGAKAKKFHRPAAGESETPPGLAFLPWTYPYGKKNATSGSDLTPVRGNGGEKTDDGGDVGSAFSRSLFSVPMTTPPATTSPCARDADPAPGTKKESLVERAEHRAILPGQSLDLYLLHNSVSTAGETGPGGDRDEADRSEAGLAFLEGSVGGGPTAPRQWRLEAQGRVCVGRVSRRFLQELELEEPRHDVKVKVAFLRKTEASKESA